MADKSKQLVIIKKEELLSKKLEIISSDDYELLPRNPIEEIKSNLTKLIKKYKNEIPANQVKNILDFNNVREPKLNNMEKSTYSIQSTEELINGLLKEYYRQKKGIAMGSVIGPKLADNYMNKIDERISSLTVSSKHIEEYANRLRKNLKFTSEDEQQNRMDFLDVTIKREERSVSFKNKKNVFNMELRKILNRTTQQENIDIEVKQLFKKFQLNDYPKHILCKWYKLYLKRRFNVKNNIEDISYAKFPYVAKVFEKYKPIFKRFSICIVANQKNKMSNIISIMNSENSPGDQFKIAGVVYRMSCTCGSPNYYIGETGRRLELRVKEHEAAIRLRRTESAWFLHCNKFNCNISIKNTKVLYRIENNLERKIVEHFCIAEHVNLLNLNAGMVVDACWERLLGIKRNQRITS
ncbi:uncharacterized protein [Centruroides vittatus]|uniref:uncharacterized protein n=1 Tax=Centruroides vittatus TaxID=120091 RepID=UPI003510CA82